MSNRNELIEQANALGLEFQGNISNVNLQAMVDEELAKLPEADPEPVKETPPASPAMKADVEEEEEEDEKEVTTPRAVSAQIRKRLRIKAAKDKAMKRRVVTLTNKDNRENDVVTNAYLSFENQYFGMSKLVPLDIPVELEDALIKIAEKCTMTLHKAEIVNGKPTGNRIPVIVKKYAVSYGRQPD